MDYYDDFNWAGNVRYSAPIAHPKSLEELQELVAGTERVRALGSRHSFNALADSRGTLVSLEALQSPTIIDIERRSVTVSGGVSYGLLSQELQRNGMALHNLASLPHISVAGAIATGTHGSGDQNGNLATAVSALEIVTDDGELMTVTRSHTPNFAGMVVALGALGIVSRVTLDIEPSFLVRQDVYENLPWVDVLDNFDAVMGSAYSVSLFTNWEGETVDQAWVKSREERISGNAAFFGGTAASKARHPLPNLSAVNCSDQLGVVGPWSDRLAHFRMAFTPSNGHELQTEYHVPREHAEEAIAAMRALSTHIAPLLLVSEIRTIAADDLWLSPNYQRNGVALHFTWKPDQAAVETLLPELEDALTAFTARPHWGKLFHADAGVLETRYPRLNDFRALADQLDPTGKFRNKFLQRAVFGGNES